MTPKYPSLEDVVSLINLARQSRYELGRIYLSDAEKRLNSIFPMSKNEYEEQQRLRNNIIECRKTISPSYTVVLDRNQWYERDI